MLVHHGNVPVTRTLLELQAKDRQQQLPLIGR